MSYYGLILYRDNGPGNDFDFIQILEFNIKALVSFSYVGVYREFLS